MSYVADTFRSMMGFESCTTSKDSSSCTKAYPYPICFAGLFSSSSNQTGGLKPPHPVDFLIDAAQGGETTFVEHLLKEGVDCNEYREGSFPLWEAAMNEQMEVLQVFLRHRGVDPNLPSPIAKVEGATALSEAAHRGLDGVVRLLLQSPRVDVNQPTKDGRTPLWRATNAKRIESVKILLTHPGVDVMKANQDGHSPLDVAKARGAKEIVALLEAHMRNQAAQRCKQ
mmetsp:Transcript_12480/g.23685  ORF Transcript_12480/g.23685 Transcript_12480/m.23685 type:complete len:227 (+) Transcript_12480:324-1004(+)|eukprot:CAMPEP_0114251548 /NCGR_PEP_ID=MMETSP0058-20121206/15331_1 /TAXON_ID=36894 /ORGANISM="Pyramimonas parkeae, CCMP726" /LENGTH=226 /DNA_ID=CAMNT_0001365361 /DNA_START=461 /DNA_END=1141 /DNA_ORIENTATION=+